MSATTTSARETCVPIPRQIVRREVLAFIALHGEEAVMPHQVTVREYHYDDRDWHCVSLDVDTENAVRFWAKVFDHPESHLIRHDYPERGRAVIRSHGEEWRGLWTDVTARIDHDAAPAAPLPDDTTAQLAALAGAR